jgi:hypothetical protein
MRAEFGDIGHAADRRTDLIEAIRSSSQVLLQDQRRLDIVDAVNPDRWDYLPIWSPLSVEPLLEDAQRISQCATARSNARAHGPPAKPRHSQDH